MIHQQCRHHINYYPQQNKMNWKQSLDRFLTEPPYDAFDGWAEDVVNKLSEAFYNANEDWVNDCSGQCNMWMNELFRRAKSPTDAALIIERALKIYQS
jgi:hypothetical protein